MRIHISDISQVEPTFTGKGGTVERGMTIPDVERVGGLLISKGNKWENRSPGPPDRQSPSVALAPFLGVPGTGFLSSMGL